MPCNISCPAYAYSPSSRSSGIPSSRIRIAMTTPKTIAARIHQPKRSALRLISILSVTEAPLSNDDAYVTNNELLTAPDGLRRILFSLDSPSQYFPLVYTTFRVEHALWGLNPTGYHWINLVLHVANALLVWAVLARLKIPGAW